MIRFLWVSFQLDDICEATSDATIQETLDNLPEGLTATYERVISKILRSKPRAKVASSAFRWLACAPRPMRVDELQEAVAFEPVDRCWNPDKIPDADVMIESCRGLVTRNLSDGTLRFAHYTVQQCLCMPSNETAISESTSMTFSRESAEVFVGQRCMTYLLLSDFQTQIVHSPYTHESAVGPGDISKQIPKALSVGDTLYGIIYRAFDGKTSSPILNLD